MPVVIPEHRSLLITHNTDTTPPQKHTQKRKLQANFTFDYQFKEIPNEILGKRIQ